ncbi:2032_t:CDS:2, partial [Cetraspora pellucida]
MDIYLYVTIIATLFSYSLYKIYFYPIYFSPIRKIPGPPLESFVFGHLPLLKIEPDKCILRLVKKYGGIFRLYTLFNEPLLVITDRQLVQKILNSYDYLRHGRALYEDYFGKGIVRAEGNDHKRQRKMMDPIFSFASSKKMVPMCIQAAHQLKNYWMKQIADNKEERITITDFISKITLDIIGLVGFNYEFNSLTYGSELGRAHNAISEYDLTPIYSALTDCFPFIRKIPFSFNIKYLNGLKVAKNISEKFVTDRKNNHIL